MAQQRLRKVDIFKKATMNDKEEFAEEYQVNVQRNKICCCQLNIVKLIKFSLT